MHSFVHKSKKMKTVLILLFFYLFIAPYNKVEESFNTQAIHDLIYYGPFQLNRYDHFEFPGVVPRTFIGPCLLYIASFPFIVLSSLFTIPKFLILLIVRGILGYFVYRSILECRQALYRIYGPSPLEWFEWMYMIQFHFLFWSTRTLPNIFAFILTNYAYTNHLLGSLSHSKKSRQFSLNALALFVGTAVVFRSEISILGFFMIASDVIHQRYSLSQGLKTFFMSFTISLGSTLVIDSWFWQKPLFWPELHVFLFNAIKNGSINYGISPWYYYFTHLLPRISPVAYPLSLFSLLNPKTRKVIVPSFLYVVIYSFLPHKEWRFIVYVTTPMNVVAALVLSKIQSKTKKYLVKSILSLFFIQSLFFLWISSWNYPGGVALERVHAYKPTSIYIDAFTAMTGASRFLERCPGISFS